MWHGGLGDAKAPERGNHGGDRGKAAVTLVPLAYERVGGPRDAREDLGDEERRALESRGGGGRCSNASVRFAGDSLQREGRDGVGVLWDVDVERRGGAAVAGLCRTLRCFEERRRESVGVTEDKGQVGRVLEADFGAGGEIGSVEEARSGHEGTAGRVSRADAHVSRRCTTTGEGGERERWQRRGSAPPSRTASLTWGPRPSCPRPLGEAVNTAPVALASKTVRICSRCGGDASSWMGGSPHNHAPPPVPPAPRTAILVAVCGEDPLVRFCDGGRERAPGAASAGALGVDGGGGGRVGRRASLAVAPSVEVALDGRRRAALAGRDELAHCDGRVLEVEGDREAAARVLGPDRPRPHARLEAQRLAAELEPAVPVLARLVVGDDAAGVVARLLLAADGHRARVGGQRHAPRPPAARAAGLQLGAQLSARNLVSDEGGALVEAEAEEAEGDGVGVARLEQEGAAVDGNDAATCEGARVCVCVGGGGVNLARQRRSSSSSSPGCPRASQTRSAAVTKGALPCDVRTGMLAMAAGPPPRGPGGLYVGAPVMGFCVLPRVEGPVDVV